MAFAQCFCYINISDMPALPCKSSMQMPQVHGQEYCAISVQANQCLVLASLNKLTSVTCDAGAGRID